MVYAVDGNIMGESLHIIQKAPVALVVGSTEIVLKVNADKPKYMFMFLDQNARRSQYIKTDDRSFESVFEF